MHILRTRHTPIKCSYKDVERGHCRRRAVIKHYYLQEAYCIDHAYLILGRYILDLLEYVNAECPTIKDKKEWLKSITVIILRRSYGEKQRSALFRFANSLIDIAIKTEKEESV